LTDYVHTTGQIVPSMTCQHSRFDIRNRRNDYPFISLENKMQLARNFSPMEKTLLYQISLSEQCKWCHPLRPDWKYWQNISLLPVGFSRRFTLEKIRGEAFISGKPPLSDFLSAALAFNGTGLVRKNYYWRPYSIRNWSQVPNNKYR